MNAVPEGKYVYRGTIERCQTYQSNMTFTRVLLNYACEIKGADRARYTAPHISFLNEICSYVKYAKNQQVYHSTVMGDFWPLPMANLAHSLEI